MGPMYNIEAQYYYQAVQSTIAEKYLSVGHPPRTSANCYKSTSRPRQHLSDLPLSLLPLVLTSRAHFQQ